MRTHIAKALQARSMAIKNAITRYNTAAFALEPPAPSLTWDQVVEYTFLADFDFLRATDGELLNKPWSRPAYCLAMDSYFKILRAQEEIVCLNIEICRLVTWINDEDQFFQNCELELVESGDSKMAVLVRRYRMERGHSDIHHMKRFWRLAKTPGFTGTLVPGVSCERWKARHLECQRQRDAAREVGWMLRRRRRRW
jgi:hypothetical protein